MLSIAEKMDERIRQPFHIGARCKESRDTFTHSIRNSSDTCRNDGRAEQLRFDQHVRRTLDARREQSRISCAEDRGSIASSAEQLKCASEISRRVREFVAHRSISRDDKHSIRDSRDRATRDFREQHRLLLIADPKHASDKHLMRSVSRSAVDGADAAARSAGSIPFGTTLIRARSMPIHLA